MNEQEQLKRELSVEREQLASALADLRGDVAKVKTRVPLALGVLGALRLALKLRRRA
ncbi:MAG TPA: hypothetical protein VGH52_10835 [Gaiellaceae bacterium]